MLIYKTIIILLLTVPMICAGISEKERTSLFNAIEIVESGGNARKINSKEMAFGAFQIRKIYVRDVNRIIGYKKYKHEDAFNVNLSKEMMIVYWSQYCTKERIGRIPTVEDYARIHNKGPDGWKKKSSEEYWKKVKAVLDGGKNE